MIDTLIVVKDNSYGLTRDAELLATALAEAGIAAEIAGIADRSPMDWLLRRKRARRIIHIERVFPRWTNAGEANILVPNQERFPHRHLRRLRGIDLILAKTREAARSFEGRGAPVDYLGFTSEDRLDSAVQRDWGRVLHLAGGSTLKGTEDVLALWERHPEWPELLLVQKRENAPANVPTNVRLIDGYMSDAELRRLQNECGIHLCPSRSEGWGHNIVEGLSCGALVIATDAPPMNEHVSAEFGLLVAANRQEPRHLGTNYYVDVSVLERAIGSAIAMPQEHKVARGALARDRFVAIDRDFSAAVRRLLGSQSA
ncbi:glycosyltransferase [Mesorhizobium sp. VNQ89]|uniref:glycosyltransferase n=1 Tax=Mesorhizobium quangtriensis TaxID=3157709 RepID=UPI0032B7C086